MVEGNNKPSPMDLCLNTWTQAMTLKKKTFTQAS